jgi:hypothetical protein
MSKYIIFIIYEEYLTVLHYFFFLSLWKKKWKRLPQIDHKLQVKLYIYA